MPKVSKQDLYDDLKQLMVNKFDYGDELQSGDEGFENLLDTGTIADKEGKRIPFSQGRTERDRVDKLGDKLKKGYPLYIYKKGELYPHEVKYNKATGQIEVSEKTTKDMKPMEKPKKPGLLTRYFDLIARMFGGEIESCHKWREYCYQKDAIKNANDPKRVDRRLRNDSKLNQADRVENKSSRDTYRSFVSLLKNRLDYGKELNQDGNAGIKKLLEEGSIRDKNGNAIGAKSGSRDDLVSAIGERLYKKQEPLYVYKPGDEYPHEIYLNRNGQLKMSPVPINEMKNEMAKPDFLARVGNFFNRIVRWKSDSVFDYERSNIRRDLLSRFSRPEILEQRRALNKVKQGEQPKAEPKQPEAEQKQPKAEQKQPEARQNEEKVQKTPDIKSAGLENNPSSERQQRGPGKDETMSFLNRAGRTKSESGAAMNADWNAGESLHKNFVSELYDKNPQKAEIIGSRILKDGDSEELTKFQESLGKAQKALGEDGGKKLNGLLEQFYDSGMSLEDGAKIFNSDDPAAAMEDRLKKLQSGPDAKNDGLTKEEALNKYNQFVNDQKDNEFGKDPEWQKGASTLGKFIGQIYDAMPDFVKNVIDAILGTAQPAAVNKFIKSAGHAQTTMNDPEGTKTASLMSDFFQSGKSLEEGTKAFNAADPAMEVDKMITPAKNMPENQPPIQEQSQPISQPPVQEQNKIPVQPQNKTMTLEERLEQNRKSIQSLREQLAGLEKETQQLQKELKGIAGPSALEKEEKKIEDTGYEKMDVEEAIEPPEEEKIPEGFQPVEIKNSPEEENHPEMEYNETFGDEEEREALLQDPDTHGNVDLLHFDDDSVPNAEEVKQEDPELREVLESLLPPEQKKEQSEKKKDLDAFANAVDKFFEENPIEEQKADQEPLNREQPAAPKSEVDGLLDKLKEVNGGKELSTTVKSNMQQLYDDAQAGKKALQDAIDSPDYDKFAGGNTVNAIAAYQFVKSSISGNYATPNMVAMIGEKNFVKDWQDYTKISPNVVYASNYPHNKEFFKEHVLSEKGTNELADSVSSGLDRVVSSNGKYTAEDVFWKSDIQAGLWHDADEKTEQKENKSEIKIGPKENSVKKDTAQKNNPDKNKQVQQNKPQQTQHQQPQQSAGMGALG